MRRIIFIFSFFAVTLFCGKVSAQNSIIAKRIDPEYKIVSTLITEYRHPQTIACYNTDDGRTVFVLAMANRQTIGVEISGYYINDIAVDTIRGDTLYFCGYTLDNDPHGIIGFFDVNSLFFSSGSIYYQDNLFAGDNANIIKKLTRLVCYRKSDNIPYVAAIGRTKEDYPCIVDWNNQLYGGYIAGYVKNRKEEFTDIKRANTYSAMYGDRNFLVTSGTESTYGTYISLRYYDRDNVLPTVGDQNYINTFLVNSSDMREWVTNKNVLVDQVKDNIISTVSYRHSHIEIQEKIPDNIHIAFYQLDMLVNQSLFSMTKSVEVPYLKEQDVFANLHRYIRKPGDDKPVFLQTTPLSGIKSSTFCEVDYSDILASSPLHFMGSSDIRLQGLSNYFGMSKYLMSGYSVSDKTRLMYEVETYGQLSTCVAPDDREFEDKEPMASIREYQPFVVMGGINDFDTISYRIRATPVFIECMRTASQE